MSQPVRGGWDQHRGRNKTGPQESEKLEVEGQAGEGGVMPSAIAQNETVTIKSFDLYPKSNRKLMEYSKLGGG